MVNRVDIDLLLARPLDAGARGPGTRCACASSMRTGIGRANANQVDSRRKIMASIKTASATVKAGRGLWSACVPCSC